MRYCGGKSRISKEIASIIHTDFPDRTIYEPFCGGLSATVSIQPYIASDASERIIELYDAVRNGWEPPKNVTEKDYENAKLRNDPEATFIGHACSFGGKFFGGYARSGTRNYALNGYNSLKRKIAKIKNVELKACWYDQVDYAPQSLIYCDPPYSDTTQAYDVKGFCSASFFSWCEAMAKKGHILLVSEFSGPYEVYKEFHRRIDMRKKSGVKVQNEKLFIFR